MKVAVIGNSGSGKSTMCRVLCGAHTLPYFSIDKIQWQPGWILRPEDDYNERHRAFVAQEHWLIDGFGTWRSIQERFAAADIIIFVDHPIWHHYWWLAKQQIKWFFFGRDSDLEGSKLIPMTLKVYAILWHLHWDIWPKLVEHLHQISKSKHVIYIRSPQELKAFCMLPEPLSASSNWRRRPLSDWSCYSAVSNIGYTRCHEERPDQPR